MGGGLASRASERKRAARTRARELQQILERLRAEEPLTSRDVELAEAAAETSRHYRAVARRNAAEARAASIALSRAAVNHRAAISDLATYGRWQAPDAEPPVVGIEPARVDGSTSPDSAQNGVLPRQRTPLDVHQSPRMSASYELADDRATPARARRLIRSRCRHLPADQLEVAVLLTSEVVTNAIVHSDGPARLGIHMADDVLRVVVTDGGRGEVRVAEDFHSPESGHGLRMVDAMSSRWGVDVVDDLGKRVWFELPL